MGIYVLASHFGLQVDLNDCGTVIMAWLDLAEVMARSGATTHLAAVAFRNIAKASFDFAQLTLPNTILSTSHRVPVRSVTETYLWLLIATLKCFIREHYYLLNISFNEIGDLGAQIKQQ